jgi:hypothetical protein
VDGNQCVIKEIEAECEEEPPEDGEEDYRAGDFPEDGDEDYRVGDFPEEE